MKKSSMKKMLLLFTFLCLLRLTNAQTAHPFPHANAIWGQFEGVYVDNAFSADYYSGATHFYVASGDSFLNTFTYIKIYASDSMGNPFNIPPRLIREDQDRVYYFLPDAQADTLLYDFSLQPGETANVYSDWGSLNYPTVDSIGVIQTGNQVRKCIYFNHVSANAVYNQLNNNEADNSPLTWIEGIGSNDGLFVPYGGAEVVDGIAFLTCFKENDTLKYGDECELIYDGEDDVTPASGIHIFPTPTSGNIIIQANAIKGKTEITVNSLPGEKVFSKTIQSSQTLYETVDLSMLAPGTYIITIKSAEIGYTRKIQIAR
jgi:hypothetical protein